MGASVAVVGGGILGSLSALLLSQRGFDVTLFDDHDSLLSGASSSGEGKIHLGLIYPLGDTQTRRHMLEGALSFSKIVNQATGVDTDWTTMSSTSFLNLVMPDSLMTVDEVIESYREHDHQFQALKADLGDEYLGKSLSNLFAPDVISNEATGLPGLLTEERAVDPTLLSALISDAVVRSPRVRLMMRSRVTSIEDNPDGVEVSWSQTEESPQHTTSQKFHLAINASWESQMEFVSQRHRHVRNLRYKAMVRIPLDAIDSGRCHTATMTVGPFGDVVVLPTHVYLSWYPVARLAQEESLVPSEKMHENIAAQLAHGDLVVRQVAHLSSLKLIPDMKDIDLDRAVLGGGFVVGEGKFDIERRESGLHSRPPRGVIRDGRVYTPLNYKLTTAPLSAKSLVDEITRDVNP